MFNSNADVALLADSGITASRITEIPHFPHAFLRFPQSDVSAE
jgi:hypothetical protein